MSTKQHWTPETRDRWNQENPTYYIWRALMRRCGVSGTPTEKEKKLFIDNGITVCDEWKSRELFSRWLYANGWMPNKRLCVVRVDKTIGYTPGNCIVTSHAKSQNFRSNLVRINGKTIRDLIDEVNPGRSRRIQNIRQRIKNYKWSVDDAIMRDVTPRNMLTKLKLKKR